MFIERLLVISCKPVPLQDSLHEEPLTLLPCNKLILPDALRRESLLDECLLHRNAFLQTVLPAHRVERNEVDMQVRRSLVQMHHGVEHVQIWIPFPEAADVFV